MNEKLSQFHYCSKSHYLYCNQHGGRQEARRLDSHTLTVDVPDAPQTAPPRDPQPIRFDVVYTLPEYLGFVRDHLADRAQDAAFRRLVSDGVQPNHR